MTKSQRIRDSAVMISSTMPSAKYPCSGSPLILANGNTAIDGLSGSGKAFAGVAGSAVSDVGPARQTRSGRAMFFEALLANVGELGLDFAAHLTKSVFGDADAAGFGDAFEPRRDVDAVAEDVVSLDQYVAEMDADAPFHAPLARNP